jgi:hypothetical protein
LSDWSSYITGQFLLVDGGLAAKTAYAAPTDSIPVFLESGDVRAELNDTFSRHRAVSEITNQLAVLIVRILAGVVGFSFA